MDNILFGLNNWVGIECDKCNLGIDIKSAMAMYNHTSYNDIYTCSCGEKFSYFDGRINDMCSEHSFSAYSFISDIVKHGSCTIKVGESFYIDLEESIPIINKIVLSPQGTPDSARVYVVPYIINDRQSIKVISSEVTDMLDFVPHTIKKVGEEVLIAWTLYGSSIKPKVAWVQLLLQAKEEIINCNYSLSFLSSVIALESYINSKIFSSLREKGINEDTIEIILKGSNISDKLFKLLKSVCGITITSENISNNKLMNLFATRNHIAHGKPTLILGSEASDAFRIVVSTIMRKEFEQNP